MSSQAKSALLSRQSQSLKAVLLSAPLAVVLLCFFIGPLLVMLSLSVRNGEIAAAFPKLTGTISAWDGSQQPPPALFEALRGDMVALNDPMTLGEAGRRLDFEVPGFRSLIFKTSRELRKTRADTEAAVDRFASIDPRWTDRHYWVALKRASTTFTPVYLLAALDLEIDDNGNVVQAPEDKRVYINAFARTFKIAGVVTALCLLLGYPLAYAIVVLPKRFAEILTFCVILPFWTSLLVRTSAWIVMLSKEGVVNRILLRTGVTTEPLALIFNRIGLYIVMVHILLPFMVLPIRSVMKGIPTNYMKASASLGARPTYGFLHVYLPLTLPGVSAGCLMTFIIAAGYYITPALVGGASDNMISFFIAFHTNSVINWGMASALGVILLLSIVVIFFLFGRVLGPSRKSTRK